MAYVFDFDRVNRILGVRYHGEVSDLIFKACYRATPRMVDKTDPRAMVIDLSGVTAFNASPQGIHELADFKPTVRDPTIPRYVVAPTPYMYGMSRMFQLFGGDKRPMLRIVKSMDEAYAELGVTDPQFEPLPPD